MLSHEWKLCMITFLIMQHFNIFWTALNWDLLTLLTFIWTQNRIKKFIVNIMYRWISLSTVNKEIINKFSLIWFEFIYSCDIDLNSIHEENYVMCIKWTKLSERENHSLTTWWLHIVETINWYYVISNESIAFIQRVMLK